MALTEQDLQAIQTVVKLNNVALLQAVDDKFRINNDILMQEMRALEHRAKLDSDKNKQDIIEAIGDMIDTGLLPQIDNHEKRITKLETKTA